MMAEPMLICTAKIDDLGRLVIPKDLRQLFGIGPRSLVDLYLGEGGIVLRQSRLNGELQNQLNLLRGKINQKAKGDGDDHQCAREMLEAVDTLQEIIDRYTADKHA